MSTATLPTWVEDRREVKAGRIARALTAAGHDAATAARLDDEGRAEVYARAGVRPGTGTSWRIAVEMLAGSTRRRAACPTCKIGDPLGVPGPPLPAGHDGRCTR